MRLEVRIKNNVEIDKMTDELMYQLRGCLMTFAANEVRSMRYRLSVEATSKLKKKTDNFENLHAGIGFNTKNIISDNSVTINWWGYQENQTPHLRIFAASKNRPRYNKQNKKKGKALKKLRYTGQLPRLDITPQNLEDRLETFIRLKLKIK